MVIQIHRRHHLWTLPLLLVYTFGRVHGTGPVDAPAGPSLNLFGRVRGCPDCTTPPNKVETYGSVRTPSPAPSENPFSFLGSAYQFGRSTAPSPTPYPTSSFAYSPSSSSASSSSSSSTWESTGNASFLIAAFFLIAAGWLFVAFLYAVLVLVVIRLRRRGPMDIHDEYFGRIYLFGSPSSNRGCYIPLGWLLRRYVMALNDSSVIVNRMSRAERRASLEILFDDTAALKERHLKSVLKKKAATISGQADEKEFQREDSQISLPVECGNAHVEDNAAPEEKSDQLTDLEGQATQNELPELADDIVSNAEPVCSICLGEYDANEAVFDSPTCPHRFHRACILDWLERRDNTECPCCRGDIIDEEEVWRTVTRLRRQQRIRSRRQVFFHRLRQYIPFGRSDRDNPDESMETERTEEEETESPIDEILRNYPLELPPTPPPCTNLHSNASPVSLSPTDHDVAVESPTTPTSVDQTALHTSLSPSFEQNETASDNVTLHPNVGDDGLPTPLTLCVTRTASSGEDRSSSFEEVYLTTSEEHPLGAGDEPEVRPSPLAES